MTRRQGQTRRQVERPEHDGYWFVRKRFGFGASPATWQGWLSTAIFVAVIAFASWRLPTDTLRLALIVPVTLIFIVFVWTHTKDGFGWRWGGED